MNIVEKLEEIVQSYLSDKRKHYSPLMGLLDESYKKLNSKEW